MIRHALPGKGSPVHARRTHGQEGIRYKTRGRKGFDIPPGVQLDNGVGKFIDCGMVA